MLEPLVLGDNTEVAVARTIDSVKGTRRHYVEVINMSPFPVTLPANKVLAKVVPLEHLKDDSAEDPSVSSVNTNSGSQEEVDLFNEAMATLDINESLTATQTTRLKDILYKHRNVFAYGQQRLGKIADFHATIDTGDAKPVSTPPYHASPKGREFISETIATLLAEDIIEPSDSPWASNVVLITQKGKVRFCVDYRKLNEVTKADQYPLPRIDDYLNQFQGKSWFSTFDANSGFHQIPIEEKDREKLAFRTHEGLFQYKRMPFGIRNGPSIFQRIMDQVLGNAKWSYALVYIDDIVVYSKTFDEHLEHLDKLFTKLSPSKLTLSIPKSHLCHQEIVALGHNISRLGIGLNKANLRAISEFPRPTRLKDVQSFLGLTGYYRKHLPKFALRA